MIKTKLILLKERQLYFLLIGIVNVFVTNLFLLFHRSGKYCLYHLSRVVKGDRLKLCCGNRFMGSNPIDGKSSFPSGQRGQIQDLLRKLRGFKSHSSQAGRGIITTQK